MHLKRRLHEAARTRLGPEIERAIQKRFGRAVILAFVKSRSEPGVRHEIRVGIDHVIYCSCAGWRRSKDKPKICYHLRRFKETIKPREM